MCVCVFFFFFFSQGVQLVGPMPVLAACHLIYIIMFNCIALYCYLVFMLWRIKFSLSLSTKVWKLEKQPALHDDDDDDGDDAQRFNVSSSCSRRLDIRITRGSSADEIANLNFLSCARKRLCVGTQVYRIE